MNDDFDIALERICADRVARRELLWLRAMEKQDEESARDLERVEPSLRACVERIVAEFIERGNRLTTLAERRDGYGRLYDERFEYHAQRLTSKGLR